MKRFTLCLLIFVYGCTNKDTQENNKPSVQGEGVVVLEPKDFKEVFASASDAVLVDVRNPRELSKGIIKGAINIDFTAADFSEKIETLDKSQTYFLYCKSGKRSSKAAKQMLKQGFKNLYTLSGGLKNWTNQELEVVNP